MIKKEVFAAALLILILVQTGKALEENYNNYTSLDLNVKVSTNLEINKKTSSGVIEYLYATVELFPRTSPEQQIIRQEVTTNPEAVVRKQDGEIKIEWEKLDAKNANYSIDSDIKTYNRIRQITRTIDFPIQKLDPELKVYTNETGYIDINEAIRNKATEIAEGETDLYITSYKVGEWVRKNTKYDLNTLTANAVQKSSWVLENKEGVCDEITNLFISMMRSLGIPARFVSGVVYSNIAYSFENHGWAEIYLPEYGWVPFDVTFGEYGWLDPSHVKMSESLDSGEAAITYNWGSRNAEPTMGTINIDTTLKQKTGKTQNLARIEARAIEPEVGFGSHVILELTAENLQDYYLPLSISITKAPMLVEKESTIHTLLRPEEKKKFYWRIEVPENLDPNYIYTAGIEAESPFAEKTETTIRYGQGFKKYTKEWAEETYKLLNERESKITFTNLELDCKTDKEKYLSIQTANITCTVNNLGNKNIDKINLCAEKECKEISTRIAEQKEIGFEIEIDKRKNVTITAETEKYIKEQRIDLNVTETPQVKIISYEPEIMNYKGNANMTIKLFTKAKAKDITIELKNIGEIKLEELEGIYPVSLTVKGKQLRDGLNVKMSYRNEKGELFITQEKFDITIKDIPWYARILNFIGI